MIRLKPSGVDETKYRALHLNLFDDVSSSNMNNSVPMTKESSTWRETFRRCLHLNAVQVRLDRS